MIDQQIKNIFEGLLMAATDPLTIDDLAKIFAESNYSFTNNDIKDILNALSQDYAERGIEIVEVASGYRIQVKNDLAPWIAKLKAERPARYSRALMETLALIAYRQPITRAEIEDVRGVSVSSNIIKTLLEHEWIRVVGHKEVPGRPALLATTKKFLDYFNLKSLEELPALMEFTEQEADLLENSALPPEQVSASDNTNIEFDSELESKLDINTELKLNPEEN
ncbi:MAG: SMC-Scp complex subunit ScpB [Gammaproteobacteria bacterium]|nr:SMC-Scp complex subunit ScpB [Gammaproteobacteria bacterium]